MKKNEFKIIFKLRFLKMVRSRTPKITLHTEEARCVLYDTSPDFEAVFYNNTKFHITKEGSIKITNPDGTSLILDSNSRSTCLSPDMQEMLEKSHKVNSNFFACFFFKQIIFI